LYLELNRIQAIGRKDDTVLRIALGTILSLTQDYLMPESSSIKQIVENYNGQWLRKK